MFPSTSMPDRNWWQELWPRPKETVQSLGIKANMTVVDLCCGDGYFTVPMAEMVDKVYGLELDINLLNVAEESALECGVMNCQWVQCDAMKLTSVIIDTGNVDCVVIANTFHGIPHKSELVHNVYALLKPDGIFAVINWHKRDRDETVVLGLPRGPKSDLRMSPMELSDIVIPCGFRLEKTFDVSDYHYACIFVKI